MNDEPPPLCIVVTSLLLQLIWFAWLDNFIHCIGILILVINHKSQDPCWTPGSRPRRLCDMGGRPPRYQHWGHLGERQHARHASCAQPPRTAFARDGKDSGQPWVSTWTSTGWPWWWQTWVDLTLLPMFHQLAQQILPNSYLPKQNQAVSGMTNIKLDPNLGPRPPESPSILKIWIRIFSPKTKMVLLPPSASTPAGLLSSA